MNATYRLSLSDIDPDRACRVLWSTNATIDWDDDQTRLSARLDNCRIEVVADPTPALLITGPSSDAVRETAAILGYRNLKNTITQIKYGVACRSAMAGSR